MFGAGGFSAAGFSTYVATHGLCYTFKTAFQSKSIKMFFLGLGISAVVFAVIFACLPTRSAAPPEHHEHQQEGHNGTAATTAPPAHTVGQRLGLTAAVVVPVALLLTFVYIGNERGWWPKNNKRLRLWRWICNIFGQGHDDSLISNERRGTIDADIEMVPQKLTQFDRMFGADGRLVSKLTEELAEDEEKARMQAQYDQARKQATELEEQGRRLREMTGDAASAEKAEQLEVERQAAEAQADKLKAELEAQPASMAFKVTGDSEAAETGADEVAVAAAGGKKKRGQRHGFTTKAEDQDKAQTAAKARAEKRKTKKIEDGQNAAAAEEGKLNMKVDKVDGKALGLKFGPGLVVTAIQAGSLASEWNDDNPTRQVLEGDKVISVNGNTVNTEMLKMLRSKDDGTFEISFQQAPKKADAPDVSANDDDDE